MAGKTKRKSSNIGKRRRGAQRKTQALNDLQKQQQQASSSILPSGGHKESKSVNNQKELKHFSADDCHAFSDSILKRSTPAEVNFRALLSCYARSTMKSHSTMRPAKRCLRMNECQDKMLAQIDDGSNPTNDDGIMSAPLTSITPTIEQNPGVESIGPATTIEEMPPDIAHNPSEQVGPSCSLGLTEIVQMWDDEDSDLGVVESPAVIMVEGYRVKETLAPILRKVITKYGDIARNCVMETTEGRSLVMKHICELILALQNKQFFELTDHEINQSLTLIHDFKKAGLEVGWIQKCFEEILQAKQLVKQCSTLKKSKDKNKQLVEDKKTELRYFEGVVLLTKKELDAAEMETEKLSEKISSAKAKVKKFISHPPLDNLI
ncbi:hypothetical protein Tsubulata_000358 [Turnera subulata]|uniref:Phospholipase-like protein n=1 Tax=Turnera subulata TaxID=218843 RepID=A0A9Q0IZL8_9ROSI|nr:hypothetical protein Tsubulata_000358 [Turnera subulata]